MNGYFRYFEQSTCQKYRKFPSQNIDMGQQSLAAPYRLDTKLHHNYTGGIDWNVQLMSMPSLLKRYARAA